MFEDEYKDGKSSRREYRCRICDKSLESFEFVCDECQKRDDEFIEWDTYLEFLESEDAAYRQLMEEKEVVAANRSEVKASRGMKRRDYEIQKTFDS